MLSKRDIKFKKIKPAENLDNKKILEMRVKIKEQSKEHDWEEKPNLLQKIFKVVRDNFVGQRDDILAKNIFRIIIKFRKQKYKILDIGSGPHAIIAKKILKSYGKRILAIDCYDFYSASYIKNFNSKNNKIKLHNISDLKKNNKKYDFCLILDVLHHIDLKNRNKINKLIELVFKKTKFLIIKDHLYKNLFEKLLLIIMDISGNIKDNVKTIPIYFNTKSLNNFIEKNKMRRLIYRTDISYYFKPIIFFNRKTLHFLALFEKK